ncbi:MAG: hypothetical protein JWL70_1771, partial [Acidimicrobiia bacterium]|nr:hypothetical protein [Acidimicrobiia bacterium]
GPGTAGSDYWLSARERASAGSMGQLIVNCTGPAGSISVASVDGTADARLPFGPGRYFLGSSAKASPLAAVAVIADQRYRVGAGTLDITRFDHSALQATLDLQLAASDNAAAIHAHGTIVVSCQGLTQCQP